MIVDIFKNNNLFEMFPNVPKLVKSVTDTYTFTTEGEDYDFECRKISNWWNPAKVKDLGFSRCYPDKIPLQYDSKWKFIIHQSNYLFLFLMNELYLGKDILIEDIGGGMGILFIYLNKMGFSKFNIVENFSQLPKCLLEEMMKKAQISYTINDINADPVASNNVGVPDGLRTKITPSFELMSFYTNRDLEGHADKFYTKNGFKFLCKDKDDLAVAYCREDKHNEFTKKIKKYEV